MNAQDLAPLLVQWLARQRWFAGKGRTFSVTPRRLGDISSTQPALSIWLVDVQFQDGTVDTYQVPLVARAEATPGLEHVLVGIVQTEGESSWVYDALHDKEVTQAYLLGIRDQLTSGPIRFERYGEADQIPVGSASLVLTGEQSNTSLIFGDQSILKIFRRLEHGVNPDIEIHVALDRLGARHIARVLGSVSADVDGAPVSLGMLQEFMSSATDGWDLAKTSVRDLMAEADLHADEAGGDFASEAYRLGTATAEVHIDLASAFGTGKLSGAEQAERAAAMHAGLDYALEVVPQLVAVERDLRRCFDEFADAESALTTQRVHGDLHLGQALRTVHRWVILDFEGEPSRTMTSRISFDSPLRDVAGMLRSFDYAARYQLVDAPPSPQLEYRAAEWAERNRSAFCDGYAAAAGYDPRDHAAALRGFEADKAVYEAVYEARNRPSWVVVPLASLARLAHSQAAEGGREGTS